MTGNVAYPAQRTFLKTLPNLLTTLRAALAIVFLKLLNDIAARETSGFIILLLAFLMICLTDYLDGKLARKFGAVSHAGALFDVAVDSFYIFSSVFLLVNFGLIPFWFPFIMLAKLIEFILTSNILLKKFPKQNKPFIFDPLGRAASAMFFLLPGISCIIFFVLSEYQNTIILILIYSITALTALSSIMRFGLLHRLNFRNGPQFTIHNGTKTLK